MLKGVLIAVSSVVVLIIALVAVVAVIGVKQGAVTAAYAHGKGGSTFTSPEGKFTAVFPAVPTRKVFTTNTAGVKIDDVNYVAQSSAHDIALVDYAVLPGDIPDSSIPQFLPGVLNAFAAKSNGQVVSSTPITYLGLSALEGVIKLPNGDFVKVRTFETGHIAYAVAAQGTAENPLTYDRLVSSFHLTTG